MPESIASYYDIAEVSSSAKLIIVLPLGCKISNEVIEAANVVAVSDGPSTVLLKNRHGSHDSESMKASAKALATGKGQHA